MVDWFTRNSSNFWKGFIKVYPQLGLGLAWKLGNGAKVMVGVDLVLGGNDFFKISYSLIAHINQNEYIDLNQLHSLRSNDLQYWLSVENMGSTGPLAHEWNGYVHGINLYNVIICMYMFNTCMLKFEHALFTRIIKLKSMYHYYLGINLYF